jgi:PRTRC genetic system protein B
MLRGERSLEFFSGQLLLITRNGASEQFKFLSPAAVAAAFRNAPIDSGWLAPEIVRCGGTVHGDFAVMFIPAQVHRLQMEPLKGAAVITLKIPLPSLVFFGFGRSFFVWAIKESVFKPSAALFHCPTPNVFGDGRICWGENKQPRAGVATIAKAWQMFIASPFSGHAANGKSKSHRPDVRGLLQKLKGKHKFPPGELLSARSNVDQTITQAIGGADVDE